MEGLPLFIGADEEPSLKRRRTDGTDAPVSTVPSFIQLSSGHIIRFKEPSPPLLLPLWFESNHLVRNIVARIPLSVARRLSYLSKLMEEEEGYDEDGNMTYYHLRDQVFESYLVETRIRRAMKTMVRQWRIRKMNQRAEPPIDPITQSPPEKEVIVYDWSVKKKFVFDAKSLATLIETNLLYHESGFAMPMNPRNPWNNVDFTYGQLISIYYQLQAHGEIRWGLSTLRDYRFNRTRWVRYHHSAITMKAIQSSLLSLDSPSAKELLEDFIIMKLDEFSYTGHDMIHAYRMGMIHVPHHWYLQRWKALAYEHYEAQHFGINRSDSLTEKCRTWYRKQYLFIRELVAQRIIQPLHY